MSTANSRLLSWRTLQPKIGISRTTWWRMIRDQRAPRPIQISPGRVAWLESGIVAWIETRHTA